MFHIMHEFIKKGRRSLEMALFRPQCGTVELGSEQGTLKVLNIRASLVKNHYTMHTIAWPQRRSFIQSTTRQQPLRITLELLQSHEQHVSTVEMSAIFSINAVIVWPQCRTNKAQI